MNYFLLLKYNLSQTLKKYTELKKFFITGGIPIQF